MSDLIDTVLNPTRLETIVKALTEAHQFSIQTGISPADLLLEVFIDLSLRLSDAWRTGESSFRKENPHLSISKTEIDDLNKPKFTWRHPKRKMIEASPEISKFFADLAVLAVRLKKNPASVMDVREFLSTPKGETAKKAIKRLSKDAKKKPTLKQKREAFRRRRLGQNRSSEGVLT